jgi:outer membrane protein assembly factor BamB
MAKILLALLTLSSVSCSSAPTARQVNFNVRWIHSTLAEENYGYRHAERTAPLVEGDTIYQGNGLDSFVAMKKYSGRIVWRKLISNGVESGSAVFGNMVYFGGSDGQFYALNKENGKVVWTFPTRTETLAQPLISEGVVYFLAGNNVLYALDSKTGKQLWNYNRGEASSLSIRGGSRPTLYKGTLYVGFSDGFLAAINARDGSMVWERKLNGNLKFVDVDATAVVDENNIWVSSFDGALFCLSRVDGQIQWRLEDGGATPVSIDGDSLFFSSNNQNIYSLDKKTGVVKWKYSFEEKYGVPTQPIIYKGLVLFGLSSGNLVALSEVTGKPSASYDPGNGVFATPFIDDDGWVFVYSNQANVHALKVAWHRPQDDYEWKE